MRRRFDLDSDMDMQEHIDFLNLNYSMNHMNKTNIENPENPYLSGERGFTDEEE